MSRDYRCVCGQALFLRNSMCVACSRELGYSARHRDMLPLELAALPDGVLAPPGGAFTLARDAKRSEGLWQRCANSQTPAACNWIVPWRKPEPGETTPPVYCLSCSLNRTVPEWSDPARADNWREVELAKRRLVSSLLELGLPVRPRSEDPERGLMFDLLSSVPGGSPPMTGHDNGLITINVDEADDLTRTSVRQSMGENYRTVLGHIRHEVGHYYWDLLVAGTPWHDRFRELFGDESQDYGEALKRHYAEGAPADWPMRYISAYASSHPWEDWAETWAHYMHLIDGLDTAVSFGVNLASGAIEPTAERHRRDQAPHRATGGSSPRHAGSPSVLKAPPKSDGAASTSTGVGPGEQFDRLFDDWLQLTQVMNQLARALGERDLYPFIVAEPAKQKLAFVHELIGATAGVEPALEPAPPSDPSPAPASTPGAAPSGAGSGPTAPAARPAQAAGTVAVTAPAAAD